MSSAMEIVGHFKPVEELDQVIYNVIQRLKAGEPQAYPLRGLEVEEDQLTAHYEVRHDPSSEAGEVASLGALAVTGALFVRALVTRRPSHWAGALGAGAVALMGVGDLVRKARSALDRLRGRLGFAGLVIGPEDLVLSYSDQEIHMSIPPMKGVVLRTLRHAFDGRPEQYYVLHIELQDGRIIQVGAWTEALAARRVSHQVARAFHLSMAFQNVDVTEVDQGFSWELGPQLVEPALN